MHERKQMEIAHLNPQNYSYMRICMNIYLAWSNEYVRLHRRCRICWHAGHSLTQRTHWIILYTFCWIEWHIFVLLSKWTMQWKTKHFGLLVLCKHFNYLEKIYRLNYTVHCCKRSIQFSKVQFYLSPLIFGTCAPTNHCAWNFLPRTETISFANNKEQKRRWKWSTNQSTIQHGIL